jgi:ABC-type multidrug transport system fused ATPase/permease subunit
MNKKNTFKFKNIFSTKLLIIWNLLPPKYHQWSIKIILLTLMGAVLETLGIGLIIPTIALMADQNAIQKYYIINEIYLAFGVSSQDEIITYGILFLLCIYIAKALFLIYMSWKQAQYIFGVKAYISQRLFKKYMDENYEFHLQHNSSHLIRNITTEVEQFVLQLLSPSVLFFTELSVMLALSALLIYIEPAGAIVLFISTSAAMIIFQRFTRNHLRKWGQERQQNAGWRIQKAQEGLGAVKDVKLLGREAEFINQFRLNDGNLSLIESKQLALSWVPKYWIEVVGMMGMTLLIIISISRSDNPSEVIPALALFAAAAFRIMPSANRLLYAMQAVRYADVVVDLMIKELNTVIPKKTAKERDIFFSDKVELEKISYIYPGASISTLEHCAIKVRKGQCIGVIGKSGAGKSTLIDLILGLLTPTKGRILVDGVDIKYGLRSWQNLIGYVQQNIFLTDDTLKRNIALGISEDKIDKNAVWKAIIDAQLKEFVEQLPEGIESMVGERGVKLSGGQRQRIAIARALYHNPPILVFDEATSALDLETENCVIEAINSLKGERTLIIVAHRMSTLEQCDHIYELKNGQITTK